MCDKNIETNIEFYCKLSNNSEIETHWNNTVRIELPTYRIENYERIVNTAFIIYLRTSYYRGDFTRLVAIPIAVYRAYNVSENQHYIHTQTIGPYYFNTKSKIKISRLSIEFNSSMDSFCLVLNHISNSTTYNITVQWRDVEIASAFKNKYFNKKIIYSRDSLPSTSSSNYYEF